MHYKALFQNKWMLIFIQAFSQQKRSPLSKNFEISHGPFIQSNLFQKPISENHCKMRSNDLTGFLQKMLDEGCEKFQQKIIQPRIKQMIQEQMLDALTAERQCRCQNQILREKNQLMKQQVRKLQEKLMIIENSIHKELDRDKLLNDTQSEINYLLAKTEEFRQKPDIIFKCSKTATRESSIIIRNLNIGIHSLQQSQYRTRPRFISTEIKQNPEKTVIDNLKTKLKNNQKRMQSMEIRNESQISELNKKLKDCQNSLKNEKVQCSLLRQKLKRAEEEIVFLRSQEQRKGEAVINTQQSFLAYKQNAAELFKELNIILNQILKPNQQLQLNINLQQGFVGLKKLEEVLKQRIMPQIIKIRSNILAVGESQEKTFLEQQLSNYLECPAIFSKVIHSDEPDISIEALKQKLLGRENILMLLRMTNGYCIAGFSKGAIGLENNPNNKVGLLLSLTNKKDYILKKISHANILPFNPYFFSFGNKEVLIKGKRIVTSLFGATQSYFDSKGDQLPALFGPFDKMKNSEMQYEDIQFHELVY